MIVMAREGVVELILGDHVRRQVRRAPGHSSVINIGFHTKKGQSDETGTTSRIRTLRKARKPTEAVTYTIISVD